MIRRFLLALGLVACAESNSATVVEIPPQDTAQPPPPPVSGTMQEPASTSPSLQGVWRGSYQCAQGVTDLVLRVDRVSSPKVSAVFEFSHAGSGVQGSYSMQGRVQPSGDVTLVPIRWIEQPPGYVMVGMHGTVRGDAFSGTIDNPTCSGFGLRRSP